MSFAYFDWIAHHAEVRGASTAAIDLASQRRFTYAQFDERIDRLATHLAGLGVKKGERVAVLAVNSTDILETQFACFRLGAIFTPLNIRLTVHELAFIISDAAPVALAHDGDFASMAAELQKQCNVPHLLAYGPAYEKAISTSDRLAQHTPCDIGDICTIMYTSGTTGKPKGSQTTHLMNFINCVNLGIGVFISQKTNHLCVLPLFHTGGLNCYVNPVFHAGGCNIIMRAFDPGEALRLIGDKAVGLTHFFGVPSIYQFMGAHPAFANTDFSRLQIAGVGGAPMPVPLLKIWEARGLTLVQGYGMTETSPAVLVLDAEDAGRKAGSAGRPVLHGELKIVDDDGNAVRPGEMGELWVKGPNITPGYWNRPEANKTSFTDGWLHTGDAARQDADGFYYIVDRTKDMYISGGENVYPAEVEDTLYQIPEIAEAAVIGQPDGTWGETGLAIVVKKPGAELTETQVIAYCRERLARFKCPTRVLFIDALPRNATGKVHKPTLRASFLEKAG
ncbi:MAG: long-chain fatty acid--CoA ligase [Rhodoblastus sp.]